MKTYTGSISYLKENQVFVFGSNPQGRHGKGSALTALEKFGAVYGQGYGWQGKSYAIVTKELRKDQPAITKEQIIHQIRVLYGLALIMPEIEFLIVYRANTKNLNGFTSMEMAEMFSCSKMIPENIVFEDEFAKMITPM